MGVLPFQLFIMFIFVLLMVCLSIFSEAVPADYSKSRQDSRFELSRKNSRRIRLRQIRMHGHSNYQQSQYFRRSQGLSEGSNSALDGMPAKLFTYEHPAAEKQDTEQQSEYGKAKRQETLIQEGLKQTKDSTAGLPLNQASASPDLPQGGIGVHAEHHALSGSEPTEVPGVDWPIMADPDMEQSDQGSSADDGNKQEMKHMTSNGNNGEFSSKDPATGKDQVILLTASPQTIVLGETEYVVVTCSVNMALVAGEASAQLRPMSIEIDKHDGQSRKRLAVLSAIHGAIPIRDELTENARISGNVPVNSREPWTISITWSNPSPALAGTYLCKLTALGSNMAHVDYAYSKTDVTIKESPRLKLEERIEDIEHRLKEMTKDKERKDATILKLRTLLLNVTTLLVDTSSNTLGIKKKINLQAKAYVDLRSDLIAALDSDHKVEVKLNATEEKVASMLGMITSGMSLLHKQNRIFASGLQALKLQVNGAHEEIANARDRLNAKLDVQRQEMVTIRRDVDGLTEERTGADDRMAGVGRQIAQVSQTLNKTAEKLHNLQSALGLTDGSLRLVNNGLIGKEGRLEVFHNGQWGSVCEDGFDIKAAQVVCKQLGFGSATASFFGSAHYGQGVGIPIHLDDVVCYGEETMLVKCSHNAWGFHGCTHAEDVGIKC
ncbi:unnamed protein product [Lymnaea stagnalis]|uniref:SRCR domain-containing protein n=1 Tax=Lymnaea stagnalis TaxID=6523 RepID=A0AAV2I1T8_LYMST